MKVSLNWIRDFLDIHKSPAEIADILTSLGLEVEGFEEVRPSPVDLHRVFTGIVRSCERIPETDHLSATIVDAGDGIERSIVCGAPNVAAGQKVLVALPGANVYSKDGALFAIGERKVKGVLSQGMICAEDELGIGHDHSGIMVLPPDTPVGVSAAVYLKQESDIVYEVGLTPNRADATNHLGVARDLCAWLRQNEQPDASLRLPDLSAFPKVKVLSNPDNIRIENTEACPRFTGVWISGLQIKESPEWLKKRLAAVGIRPINNVVDITNFVRAETGQPLHAYDAKAVRGGRIIVKTLPEGTIFKTLDETDRKLFAEDLMVCDGESTPMCIGGVFGGHTSGVKDDTTDIFLESAFFNARWIRRSMLRHNLRTDAAWSFEKGVDPNGCVWALQRAALLIAELANGQIGSEMTDIYPNPVAKARIPVEYARINRLIGEELSATTIKNILTALEIGIENETVAGLTAVIPTNKPDVVREADVTEEILRVYGLDRVPMPDRIRGSMEQTPRPDPDVVRHFVSELLSAQGFHECMNLSLSSSVWYEGEQAVVAVPKERLAYVHNTANQGLDCLRPSMLPGGLETIRHNQNRRNADLRLYEFGKTYTRRNAEEGADAATRLPFTETMRLGLWVTGARQSESWQPVGKKEADFFTLKAHVQQVLGRLGIVGYQESVARELPFQFSVRYARGPQELVTLGKVHPGIAQKFDVKNAVFYADFHFENILSAIANNKVHYQEVNKFPSVRRDLALVLDQAVAFSDIRQLANKTAKKLLKEVNLFDVFEDESKLGAGKKSYAVSFVFEDPEKTLQDKEIDALLQQLQQNFESKLNAVIRK